MDAIKVVLAVGTIPIMDASAVHACFCSGVFNICRGYLFDGWHFPHTATFKFDAQIQAPNHKR